jgi:two-component system response regulator RegX3
MNQPTRILVVEDDPAILTGLEEKLTLEGYAVQTAADGEAAQDRLAEGSFDLVVLDLMLPRLDGLSVLRWLRKRDRALPVLILSAKGREEDKVAGLRAGADDYLAKPFGLSELLARVEALIRRARGPGEPVAIGSVTYDPVRRRVALRSGEEVELSRKELDLLAFLVRNRGRVVSREQILDAVWGHFAASAERAVDYHILNLRKKLEPDPGRPKHIVTRHGLGYELRT